jgi:hypothetical protein
VERERDRLRELSAGLVRLHGLLLERERRAYEARHGSVASGQLFNLVLQDEQFAWLRVLSTLIAQLDAAVDGDERVGPEDAQRAFREAYRLLKSGGRGVFEEKYLEALQDSPDVVMAHARVSETLRRATGPGREAP